MTAESLKPFISLPSGENFSSHKRSPLNLVTIGIGATFITLSIVLLGYTIWNSVRIHELQKEVNSLNRVIVEMEKRLGLDFFPDFNVPENTYNQDEDEYLEHDDDDEDDDDEDEDGDDDENRDEERIRDTLDYIDDDILDGSGLYDDDDADDDDGGDDDGDDSNYDNDFDSSSIDKIERKTRSISSSSNGIPIYQDSYALKRNRTGGPEDERIEQHLLANKGHAPTLRYDWSEKSPRPAPSTTTDGSLPARRGRYQSTSGNVLHSLHQPRHRVYRQYRNQRLLRPLLKSGKGRGKSQALTARSLPTVTAVHYHLNSTISGKHNLRPEHSKLPHDGDVYIGSPHPWARALGLDKAFSLNHGILTVKEPGLYFIYAQIYYDNRFDRNGFVIYHNVQPFLQCALFVPTNTNKSHTCYTSGVIYLEGNDELHLRDIHQDRGVMLTNAKSFIGIIKLGEI